MTELFAPVVSITTTKRRRFFWAAWWTGPPARVPFKRPDASDGGAETYEAAIAAATSRAGASLTVTDALWARAWMRILRGQDPFPSRASREPAAPRPRAESVPAGAAAPGSIWELLGVTEYASLGDLKAAFRKRAAVLHPDQGGDSETFRRLLAAYEEAKRRAARPRSGRRAPPR